VFLPQDSVIRHRLLRLIQEVTKCIETIGSYYGESTGSNVEAAVGNGADGAAVFEDGKCGAEGTSGVIAIAVGDSNAAGGIADGSVGGTGAAESTNVAAEGSGGLVDSSNDVALNSDCADNGNGEINCYVC
jgi:hypothetical protein